jgi:hypothetical protein
MFFGTEEIQSCVGQFLGLRCVCACARALPCRRELLHTSTRINVHANVRMSALLLECASFYWYVYHKCASVPLSVSQCLCDLDHALSLSSMKIAMSMSCTLHLNTHKRTVTHTHKMYVRTSLWRHVHHVAHQKQHSVRFLPNTSLWPKTRRETPSRIYVKHLTSKSNMSTFIDQGHGS